MDSFRILLYNPALMSNIEQQLQFRALTQQDEPFLKDMVYVACWDAPEEPRRPRKTLEHPKVKAYYNDWGQAGDYGLIVEINQTPLGVACIRYKESATKLYANYPELVIAIEPDYQKQGIGKILMKKLIDDVRDHCPGIRLGVNPKNVVALKLYEDFGFKYYDKPKGHYPQYILDFKSMEQE